MELITKLNMVEINNAKHRVLCGQPRIMVISFTHIADYITKRYYPKVWQNTPTYIHTHNHITQLRISMFIDLRACVDTFPCNCPVCVRLNITQTLIIIRSRPATLTYIYFKLQLCPFYRGIYTMKIIFCEKLPLFGYLYNYFCSSICTG